MKAQTFLLVIIGLVIVVALGERKQVPHNNIPSRLPAPITKPSRPPAPLTSPVS